MDVIQTINENNTLVSEKYNGCISVSKAIGLIKKEFDKEAVAQKCHDKGFNDPNSKYYQMSKDAILQAWEDKANVSKMYGTMLDDYIGMNLNNQMGDLDIWKLDNNYDTDQRLKGLTTGFDEFYKELTTKTDYTFVTREMKLYIPSANGNCLNGRFDCLFYSPSKNKYMLIDWKSNEKIEKDNRWEKLLGPCCQYDSCDGNTYTLQLHLYKKALVEHYKIASADDIEVFICQMQHASADGTPLSRHYSLHPQNFGYNPTFLDQVIDYTCKKNAMLKAKEASI